MKKILVSGWLGLLVAQALSAVPMQKAAWQADAAVVKTYADCGLIGVCLREQAPPVYTNPGTAVDNSSQKQVVINAEFNQQGYILAYNVRVIKGQANPDDSFMFFIPEVYVRMGMTKDLPKIRPNEDVLFLDGGGSQTSVANYFGERFVGVLPYAFIQDEALSVAAEFASTVLGDTALPALRLVDVAVKSKGLASLVAVNELLKRRETIPADLALTMVKNKNVKLRSALVTALLDKNQLSLEEWRHFRTGMEKEFKADLTSEINALSVTVAEEKRAFLSSILK